VKTFLPVDDGSASSLMNADGTEPAGTASTTSRLLADTGPTASTTAGTSATP
jgi:hypothetical protein